MRLLVALSLLAFVVLLIALPLLFGQLMLASLGKLHLSEGAALAVVVAIFLGSLINIPVRRIRRDTEFEIPSFAVFGFPDAMPHRRRRAAETLIAVNLGGCVVPSALAVYELVVLAGTSGALLAAVAAAVLNTVVCYRLARIVPGIGIAVPALAPALVATLAALLLAPGAAPPVAFIAGVAGPLIGADLLHLKEIGDAPTGVASIGGAGTFDGIVLSGILAAYLA